MISEVHLNSWLRSSCDDYYTKPSSLGSDIPIPQDLLCRYLRNPSLAKYSRGWVNRIPKRMSALNLQAIGLPSDEWGLLLEYRTEFQRLITMMLMYHLLLSVPLYLAASITGLRTIYLCQILVLFISALHFLVVWILYMATNRDTLRRGLSILWSSLKTLPVIAFRRATYSAFENQPLPLGMVRGTWTTVCRL